MASSKITTDKTIHVNNIQNKHKMHQHCIRYQSDKQSNGELIEVSCDEFV